MTHVSNVAVWFSCGAASACALRLAVDKYGHENVRAINNPVAEEHPDNERFKRDVSEWIGVEIETAPNIAFPTNSAKDVWEARRFMSSPYGAPCTMLLKKEARRAWEELNSFRGLHIFGFTVDEAHRAESKEMGQMDCDHVLIEAGMTKQDCFDMIQNAGLRLPEIYTISSRFGDGYPNANCIGCVKATSPTYWNHVRETFPDIFSDRAEQSRRLGVKLVRYKGRRIFLDELPPDAKGQSMKTMNVQCSIFC